jgi:hypothetical protein
MDKKILEKELYSPIRDFFTQQGFEVRGEVNHCDVCAVKDEQLVIIELKRNLSVELLVQATQRQKLTDMVYIAVPKPKRLTATSKWKDICHLLRRLELGLILVSFKGKRAFVETVTHPEPFDRAKSMQINKRKKSKLMEEFKGRAKDLNTGGSTGEKLVTAYREDALYIACCMDMLGPLSAKKLRSYGADSKKAYSILYENHYGWFYRVEKGIYELTDKGREDIEKYEQLTELLKEKINQEYAAVSEE